MWFGLFLTLFALYVILVWRYRSSTRELESKDREIESLRRRGSEFVANVSHELKTPLTSIQGYSETLRGILTKDPEKAEVFLKKIEDNTERLSLLINDLLELSRIESPNVDLEKQTFELAPLFEELKEQFSLKLATRGQALVVRNELQTLTGDRRLIEQAFVNLIENAHRYSGDRGLIEISGEIIHENGRDWAQFVVQDNGPGIKTEDLPRIFERFYRADKSRNRQSGGTGLGLAIVKHIMLSHGGQVRANSEPQKGSAFSLLFPL